MNKGRSWLNGEQDVLCCVCADVPRHRSKILMFVAHNPTYMHAILGLQCSLRKDGTLVPRHGARGSVMTRTV